MLLKPQEQCHSNLKLKLKLRCYILDRLLISSGSEFGELRSTLILERTYAKSLIAGDAILTDHFFILFSALEK